MHREISHTEEPFYQERNLSLYLMTGLIGVLIAADLWPLTGGWLAGLGIDLPTWPREFYGPYRFALLAAVIGGARILYGSVESLLEGKLGADLALAIATIAAILIGEPLVAAEVVFIGMVGECLESLTFERTQRAIRKIVEVCPRRCWLLRDGQEVRVLTSELRVGDRVVVKPGARVPVDGIVIDGRSAVDQSALTGESLPVDKSPGDEVLAGSLNQFGALTIEAKRVAEQTVVGRVIELTARALRDKAPLERTADRLARLFLPAVLGLAGITFVVALILYAGPLSPTGRSDLAAAVRLAVYPTLAVLVVACPCALILATPAAVIAALGRLAGTGVLIKSGSALERLAQVEAIAFDKTGTLTEGRLELGRTIGFRGITGDELIRIAATAEQSSEHPIAQLVVAEARKRNLNLETLARFQAHPGAGVTAQTARESLTITVGNRRLLEERKIAVPPPALVLLDKLDQAGETPLLVALEDVVIGVIGARDQVRPEAADVITELRNLGIKEIALLTGDRRAAATAIAAHVGITDVHAELLPDQKADFVGKYASSSTAIQAAAPASESGSLLSILKRLALPPSTSGKVAFVGDGINDAPALARASVGVAIGGTGTDVAAEAGDIVFMGPPLTPLPLLIRLSRQTVHIIRQNILIFAFIVNGLGILITAWLWPLLLPAEWAPLAGVVYHQVGSLLVLLNSMRLLRFDRPRSRTWIGIRQSMDSIDRWMEQWLNLDEGLHWLGHHAKGTVLTLAVILIVGYFLAGITVVGADEVAVVRRFGKPFPEPLGPGLYWTWPWPVDSVLRIQPDRVRSIEIGFRSSAGSTLGGDWAAVHGDDSFREEATLVTGDENLVTMQATLHYRIDRDRLYTYLFEVRDPESTIRAAAESVLRDTVTSQRFDDLLTVNRDRLQIQVLAKLQQRWQASEYGSEGIGIVLIGLAIHDLHPPRQVVDAYHAVARAMEKRDRRKNEARRKAILYQGEAAADELKTVSTALADHNEKVQLSEAARDAFFARDDTRRTLTALDEWQVLSDAATAIADGRNPAAVYQEYRQRRLALQRSLTDFRLAVRSLTTALQHRDKIIVDSDRVPGRRHLWLFDPDLVRPPAPVILPPDRWPPRAPREEGP